MNRAEYMKLLEIQLKDIPGVEKEEALQYYNDYFDDAGVENEEEIMKSLGSPAALAETIRRDFVNDQISQRTYVQETQGSQTNDKKKMSTGLKVTLIILTILASPLLVAIALTVVAVVATILITIFSVILSVAVSFLAIIFALGCVVALFIGLASALGAVSPFGAVVLCGVSLMIIGLCIFLFMGVVWLFGVAIPAVCKGTYKLCKKIFSKKGGK